ncbi:MAG TPA: QueT transporter family protein [Thermoanaerobacterales bacterium]|nr:QueT transporter family protein [Thermoanaerobacterales bacterium]
MKNNRLEYLIKAALIGAIYFIITIIFAPISYGPIQIRISEALTVLPFLTHAAVPGLFIGCILANIYGGYGIHDIIFGSLATLIAAYLTYKTPSKILAPVPPIIINGLIIGSMLHFLLQVPLIATILYVSLGELIACYFLGYPLLLLLERRFKDLF